jgi:radical SAM superfamily enzyme YgiQ (UPF0313 family)
MKIKLISPRMTLRPMDSDFKRLLSPSISLLVVAALTPKDHHVYLEDENIQEINTDDDPDLVGINVNVDTSHRAYRIAAAYRRKDIAWTRDLIRLMKPMHLRWHAAVSTNIGYQRKLLDEMRDSGCESLFIGFESINHRSIKSAAKMQNHVDHYERIISELHSRGIMVNASMVFGFDHDTPDIFADTVEWLVNNKIETVTAHILTPYPGTRLYQRMLQDERIIDFEPTHYNTSHVVYQPKQMTAEQLYNGYLWLYKQFYTLRNIYRRLPSNYYQWMPYLLFNLIYRKYGKLTSRFARNGLMSSLGKLARRLSYGIE